jgi:hypothetical protein
MLTGTPCIENMEYLVIVICSNNIDTIYTQYMTIFLPMMGVMFFRQSGVLEFLL